MLKSGVRKHGRALKWMALCVVLAVGPLPPTSTSRPPDIHVMNAPRPFPFFFAGSSAPVYYCEANEGKTGVTQAR